MAAHGAGYPITYMFTVPDAPGLVAQWRATGDAHWLDIPAAPAGRFDGVDAARFAGGIGYVSKAFPVGVPNIELRVTNAGGTEVGAYAGIAENYDGQPLAIAFTYDDTPSVTGWNKSTAVHQAAKVWQTPGLNWSTFQTNISIESAARTVAAGYVEPDNHTWSHDDSFSSQAGADAEYVSNKDAIVSQLGMPPQSRGRVHSAIYPNGTHNATIYAAAAKSGALTGRLMLDVNLTPEQGTYWPNLWDDAYGMVTQQNASVKPAGVTTSAGDRRVAETAVAKVMAAIDYAKTNSHPQCVIYTYIRWWTWDAGWPWPEMVAAIGAMDDIWSVGYGHLALYQRTRDRTTVTPAP